MLVRTTLFLEMPDQAETIAMLDNWYTGVIGAVQFSRFYLHKFLYFVKFHLQSVIA